MRLLEGSARASTARAKAARKQAGTRKAKDLATGQRNEPSIPKVTKWSFLRAPSCIYFRGNRSRDELQWAFFLRSHEHMRALNLSVYWVDCQEPNEVCTSFAFVAFPQVMVFPWFENLADEPTGDPNDDLILCPDPVGTYSGPKQRDEWLDLGPTRVPVTALDMESFDTFLDSIDEAPWPASAARWQARQDRLAGQNLHFPNATASNVYAHAYNEYVKAYKAANLKKGKKCKKAKARPKKVAPTTDLTAAVLQGKRHIRQLMRDKGADPNKADHALDNHTALHLAATLKDPASAGQTRGSEIVHDLLAYGADPNGPEHQTGGISPLHLAAVGGRSEIVRQLIEAWADVNKATRDGFTHLHFEAASGKSEIIVRRLIEAGADVDSASRRSGKTPLLLAAVNGHVDICRWLLDAGADLNKATWGKGVRSVTPLFAAAHRGHTMAATLLLKSGAQLHNISALGAAPSTPMEAEIERLLQDQLGNDEL